MWRKSKISDTFLLSGEFYDKRKSDSTNDTEQIKKESKKDYFDYFSFFCIQRLAEKIKKQINNILST